MGFAGAGIENQNAVLPDLGKIKHLTKWTGDRIEAPLADALTAEPVISSMK